MANTRWSVDNMGNLIGKVAVVTGANTGLGYETAKALVAQGAHVVVASRNPDKAAQAVTSLRESHPGASLEVITVDLADLSSVESFAGAFTAEHDRLDMLINNAGIMMGPKGVTTDGFERQLGTNHLGHFALTGRLIDVLAATPSARVVTVSSLAHRSGTMDFNDLMSEKRYRPQAAYGRSKLANLMFAFELQRRSEAAELDMLSVAAHPGVSATDLGDHLLGDGVLGELFMTPFKLMTKVALQDASAGALPTLRAATDPSASGGDYFGPSGMGEVRGRATRVAATATARNKKLAARLWDVSQELTGVEFL